MKNFVICEKSSAGKDIALFLSKKYNLPMKADSSMCNFIRLGDEYIIGWCRGHLLAMVEAHDYNPSWKSWKKEDLPLIPEAFRLEPAKKKEKIDGKYVSVTDKGINDLLKAIKSCINSCEIIINAGDCGREGQVITDEVFEYYGVLNGKKPIKRLWVNGLNDAELEKGFNNLIDNKEKFGLYRAGVMRSKIDWLFGINLTRAISINFKENGINDMFSAGRVQTPVATMIYERDLAIKNFKEKDFYGLSVVLSNGKESITGELMKTNEVPESAMDFEDRIVDKVFIESVKDYVINEKTGKIKSITKKEKNVYQPKLYSLSTLQQECNKLFKISASQTLEIAQKLYEKSKMLSYPRTSSNYLPKSQFAEVKGRLAILKNNNDYNRIIKLLGENLYYSSAWDDSKISDHHAIIPIDYKENAYNQLSDIERKVFDLVVKRYLSHFFTQKKEMEVKAVASVGKYDFSANSTYVLESGWTVVYDKEVGGSEIKMLDGDSLSVLNATVNSKKTTPPSRFTEGELIGAMTNIAKYLPNDNLTPEELTTFKNILKKSEGIGTEATRAPLIEKLKDVNFTELKANSLYSTPKTNELIENLYKINMHPICSPITTAKYELMFKEIESGELTEDAFMNDFLSNLRVWINLINQNKFSMNYKLQSKSFDNKPNDQKPASKTVKKVSK